ncbi:MAG TPA: N-acetyltransferase [Pseudomonas xinjiangensis]|uniref:N-acetyltransferase n=2 Tax=root TaxID=1 RepID=A0A7V1BQP8_9GAMM|nr:N-acetyltransferase [Halopseudomonas xinjiangensis]HEC47295.1 N-acetyltransferase [Halopseudomonas xinjiangensis]
MPHIDWLSNHMQHSDTFAQWIYHQFSYEFSDQPLADWQREFAEGQVNGDWRCLIAMDTEGLLGGAVLAKDDLPERPALGPWLACVFTKPQARGQGLAERLIEAICTHAKSNGIARLYLHTQDRRDYYAKRGWEDVETFPYWGKEQRLMKRELR